MIFSKIFAEAKTIDAILVFDDAEALFGTRTEESRNSTDRYANMDTSILLYHMEHFPGIAILTTNIIRSIDIAFFRRFRFVIEFGEPKHEQRESLWQQHLPPRAPRDEIDFKLLASKYSFSGGVIKNCCFKAAAVAALRTDPAQRRIKMIDLINAADEEEKIQNPNGPPPNIFS